MVFKSLPENLQGIREFLTELERRARDLRNQNLADIAAAAKGPVIQLIDHPDLVHVNTDEPPAPAVQTPAVETPSPAPAFVPPGIGLPDAATQLDGAGGVKSDVQG